MSNLTLVPKILIEVDSYSRVHGGDSKNNGGAINTRMDLSAEAVTLVKLVDGATHTVIAPGVITNDILVAGPIINGRDQAGPFSTGIFLHFYWIYNPTTGVLATISSQTPPPVGPVLPAGFTHWAYAFPVHTSGSLEHVHVKGNIVYIDTPVNILSNGFNVVQTPLDGSPAIAPNAFDYYIRLTANITTGGGSGASFFSGVGGAAGRQDLVLSAAVDVTSTTRGAYAHGWVPNITSQTVYYQTSLVVGAPLLKGLDIDVLAYKIANGD